MPSSKEVRARQNRQKERVAAQRAERQRVQQRRRRMGGAVGVVVLVIVVVLGITLGGGGKNNDTVAVAPTVPTTAQTTTTVVSAKGKPCVGMKDPVPKTSPAFLLSPGPAPTKLTTQDLKVGTGALVAKNAKVSMNYVGVSCSTGKIFDTSFKTGATPYAADLSPAGSLIAGWQQGIPGMKIGGVRLLSIPASLAYGASGRPPLIAGDEALFFLVQAVKLG